MEWIIKSMCYLRLNQKVLIPFKQKKRHCNKKSFKPSATVCFVDFRDLFDFKARKTFLIEMYQLNWNELSLLLSNQPHQSNFTFYFDHVWNFAESALNWPAESTILKWKWKACVSLRKLCLDEWFNENGRNILFGFDSEAKSWITFFLSIPRKISIASKNKLKHFKAWLHAQFYRQISPQYPSKNLDILTIKAKHFHQIRFTQKRARVLPLKTTKFIPCKDFLS